MVPLKTTINNTPIYSLGDFLQKGSTFLLLPVLTAYLSPNELGKAIFYITISTFLSGFFTLNILNSVIRFASDKINDNEYLFNVFSTITVFLILNTICLNLILIPIFAVVNYFFLEIDYIFPILSIFLSTIITPYDIYQKILITLEKPKSYLRNQFLNFFIYSSILYCLIFFKYSSLSLIIATIISYMFFYILLVNELKKTFKMSKLSFDFILLKDLLKYSTKLLPNRLLLLFPNLLDRLIISSLSISSVATYSIGYRIGEASNYSTSGFLKGYPRWLYLCLKDYDNNQLKINNLHILIMKISLCVASSMSLLAEEIVLICLNHRYYESWVIIPIISYLVMYNNLRTFWLNFLLFDKKKAYLIMYPNLMFFFTSIIFMILFFKIFNVIGIAIALLLASFLSLLVTLYYVKKLGYQIFDLLDLLYGTLFMFFIFTLLVIKIHLFIKLILVFGLVIWTILLIKNIYNLDSLHE